MILHKDFNFMAQDALTSIKRLERSLTNAKFYFGDCGHMDEYNMALDELETMKKSLTFLKRDGRNFNKMSLDHIYKVMDGCYKLMRAVDLVSESMENDNWHYDLRMLEGEPLNILHYMNIFKNDIKGN